MSTMTGIGPALRIDGPPPVPREYSPPHHSRVFGLMGRDAGRTASTCGATPTKYLSRGNRVRQGPTGRRRKGVRSHKQGLIRLACMCRSPVPSLNVGDWRDFASRAQQVS